MILMHQEPSRVRGRFVRLCCLVLLGALFTGMSVCKSARVGRLSSPPGYDDVTYCHDGMALALFQENLGLRHGTYAFLQKYGTHSPYQLLLACCAYRLFGPWNAAPYLANVLLVLAYLAGVNWWLKSLPFIPWLGALLLFLAPPFITMGVVEFRPDIAWATTVGFCTVFLVTSDRLLRDLRKAALAGGLVALALLIKPSVFAMTLLLCGAALASRARVLWHPGLETRQLGGAWKGALLFCFVVLLSAGPYWFVNGANIWHYFTDNALGARKAAWSFQWAGQNPWTYYLWGSGGRSNMGIPGWLLAGMCFVLAAVLFFKRHDLRWKLSILAAAAVGAWGVNTLAEMKTPFVGGGFYSVVIFSCAYLISEGWKTPFGDSLNRQVKWKGLVTVLAALVAWFGYSWPEYSTHPSGMTPDREAAQFFEKILERDPAAGGRGILFLQSGPAVPEAVGLWIMTHRQRIIPVSSGAFLDSESKFYQACQRVDWVVFQNPGLEGSYPTMPVEGHLEEFDRQLSRDLLWQQVAEHVFPSGKKMWIYAKK